MNDAIPDNNIIDLMPHLAQQRAEDDARRLQEIAKLAAHLEEKAKSGSSECSAEVVPDPSASTDPSS